MPFTKERKAACGAIKPISAVAFHYMDEVGVVAVIPSHRSLLSAPLFEAIGVTSVVGGTSIMALALLPFCSCHPGARMVTDSPAGWVIPCTFPCAANTRMFRLRGQSETWQNLAT